MKIRHYNESYSSKKGKQFEKVINNLWILTVVLIFVYVIITLIFQGVKNSWIIIIGAIILFIYVLNNFDYKWLKSSLASYKRGDAGELLVIEKLKSKFNDSYTYIANYSNSTVCSGDIDGILIGPKGLFILEVKSWRGRFRISGTDMYRHVSNDLYKLYKSPAEQLGSNKEKITKYLHNKGYTINIHPFIVLVDGRVEVFNGNTGIFITSSEEIANKILASSDHNFSLEQIDSILLALGIQI